MGLNLFLVFFAAILRVGTPPGNLTENQEFEVEYFFDCKSCGDSYLRGVFFKEGTTNYFGFTQNEKGDWVNTTADKTVYYHLNLSEGISSISGLLKIKPDPNHSAFSETGTYFFKLGRYTSANSSAAWSENQYPVHLTKTTPTMSPAPISTSTPNPTSTPTNKPTDKPTEKPTPVPTSVKALVVSTPNPTSSPTNTSSPAISDISQTSTPTAEVLSAETTSADNNPRTKSSHILLFVLIPLLLLTIRYRLK